MSLDLQCRSCGRTDAALILDLGVQPLANNLLTPADLAKPEPKFPLRLAVCQSCWLLQITDLVPPVALFSEYLYFSSFSDVMLRHAREAATRYVQEFGLNANSLVVEIASNDGYLLQNFLRAGVPCLGIEPAANIAKVAREKGLETLEEFFGNVDTIYHEHVFYFTLTALKPLFERHGLTIFRVERLPIHGGSLRLFAGHTGAHAVEASVPGLLAEEQRKGVASLAFYEGFARQVLTLKRDLRGLLAKLKQEGRRIAAYGASAKGSTLLNYYGVGADMLDFVADRSTYKQGRLTPGTHLPIVRPEELLARRPDYTLLLTWNFADEILAQQQPYRNAGGRFILPIPTVKVV